MFILFQDFIWLEKETENRETTPGFRVVRHVSHFYWTYASIRITIKNHLHKICPTSLTFQNLSPILRQAKYTTMLTNESVIEFLKDNPALELKSLEEQAGLPQSTLSKVMGGSRSLNEKHLQKLDPVLRKYGFYLGKTKTVAILNHKGGVGKTTTALNLGKGLSLEGKKVLIVDMDPQANLSQSVGIEEPEKNIYHALCKSEEAPVIQLADNFDLIPADLDLSNAGLELQSAVNGFFRLKKALEPIKHHYDVILVDCPPSLETLTINALIAATDIIVIVEPERLALKGLQSINYLVDELRENLNPNLNILGYLITQADARTNVHQVLSESLRNQYDKVFETIIRKNTDIAAASLAAQDIFTYKKNAPAAVDYEQLTKEVCHVL